MEFKWNQDCKHFPGVWPCDILKSEGYKSCEECNFYEPSSKRVLIIKLGAMGDVLRTIPLIKSIKKKYGEKINITWLVNPESADLLKDYYYIDRVLIYSLDNILRLSVEEFDILFSFEINVPGTIISSMIKAKKKFGYYLDKNGHPTTFNKKAEYYLEKAWSDHLNKNNRKTYQELMFEVAELELTKEPYLIKSKEDNYAKEFMQKIKITKTDKIIGINIGSAGRWPSKAWHEDKIVELVKKLNEMDYKTILLGGPEEIDKIERIANKLKQIDISIIKNNQDNTINQFISIVNLCDIIITGDTLALHIAIGLNKKTIALFFCTPPWEIEGYGFAYKIISPLLEKYFFTDEYIEELVKSISTDEVVDIISKINKDSWKRVESTK